ELGRPLRGAGDDGDHAGRGGTMRGRRELAGDVPGGDHSPPQPGGGRRCGDGGVGKGQGRRRPVAARLVVLGHGSNLPSVPDTAVVSGTLWREVRRGRNRAPPAAIGRKRAPTAPEGYPFTEPAVMPRTRNRCREKNTIIGITIEMKAPAVRTSAPSPCVPSICCRFTMIVLFAPPPRNSLAMSRSFHTHRNCSVAKAAIAGEDIGATRRQNVWKCEAPSIFALSTTEPGRVVM